MKIIIGTANFDRKYGYNNHSIKSSEEIIKILNYSIKNNIAYLDTAFSYVKNKNIQKIIHNTNLKIISKFSLNDLNLKNNYELEINKFLEEFSKLKIDTLLFHNSKDLTDSNYGEFLLKLIKQYKKNKKFKKIGVSLYDLFELKKILKIWKPDVIQVPLNPLNTQFFNSDLLKKLKKKGIEIHVRSIFLQGVLLKSQDELPKKIKNKVLIKKWNKWCEINKIDKLQYILQFIDKKEIDQIIIGVDNLKNLKDIFQAIQKYKKRKNMFTKNISFKLNKINAIEDPRKW